MGTAGTVRLAAGDAEGERARALLMDIVSRGFPGRAGAKAGLGELETR